MSAPRLVSRVLIGHVAAVSMAACLCACTFVRAADVTIVPHRQDKPPGPPLSPAEAIARMKTPPGFSVELVAAEPDIVNPVAMTFDERGRAWITESVEYPRSEAGPGRDRVKVLEDTDGDGRADKFTVFAEGLNIPSGIAVGAGGVWVANAPDILFLQDTDGDGRADKREVVVTGFGRTDTHELPNSLTWGPDGWLYGLNGVFNHSKVVYRGKTHEFTCAMFRIHPRTRDFEIFCEGTSNPWGIAFDGEGSAFVSACVIDHLWHLVESGYYHRQGGPYPPLTWKIESIVDHTHQKAAYCGIHWFDSDAYPPQYRERLYMGNIHGTCVNSDRLERRGASYHGLPEPDFLSADDAWFMPVVQKTGPDGCLYVLDWYDRYHCYQDARRDPEGIDRGRGRLYRVRYEQTPRAPKFDLARQSDAQLLALLASPNIYFRDIAQRLLWERANSETLERLEALALDESQPRKARMHALWARIGAGNLPDGFTAKLLAHSDPTYRAWGVRAPGNQRRVAAPLLESLVRMAQRDDSPDVLLQLAIAAPKVAGADAFEILIPVAQRAGSDDLLARIVWSNLKPMLAPRAEAFVAAVERHKGEWSPALVEVLPRATELLAAANEADPRHVAALVKLQAEQLPRSSDALIGELEMLARYAQTRQWPPKRSAALREHLSPLLAEIRTKQPRLSVHDSAVLLAASWGDSAALDDSRAIVADAEKSAAARLKALDAVIAADPDSVVELVRPVLKSRSASADLRRNVLAALGRLTGDGVAQVVLDAYAGLDPPLRPQAIEMLTGRPAWARALLEAIGRNEIPAEALNGNQVRKLLASRDAELVALVQSVWGTVRTERSPEREKIVDSMRDFVRANPGNARAGVAIYDRVCGQCHKLHGRGQEVGPDITVNGRASLDQLLSNVFDPSLVIGRAYQAHTVVTADGRVLSGLLVEDTPQRVVLKVQGGKLETIARADVDQMEQSKLSLMPEGLEKQLSPQELADLFALLRLDKPPDDPTARQLPLSDSGR